MRLILDFVYVETYIRLNGWIDVQYSFYLSVTWWVLSNFKKPIARNCLIEILYDKRKREVKRKNWVKGRDCLESIAAGLSGYFLLSLLSGIVLDLRVVNSKFLMDFSTLENFSLHFDKTVRKLVDQNFRYEILFCFVVVWNRFVFRG